MRGRRARRGIGIVATRRAERPGIAVLALVAVVILAGCGNERNPDQGGADAARTRTVSVFFPRESECDVHAFSREVPDGPILDVTRATLTALIAGPTAEEAAAGYRSAIPDTLEILRHRMRRVVAGDDPPHHGRRVEIQSVEGGEDGILHVSFSPEISAYDHGAVRVCAIVRQVRETVRQFPEWKDVAIAVDGKTQGVLQP